MKLDSWNSVAGIARGAWVQGAAWSALNLSPTGSGGVSAALWAVGGALLLRLTTLAAPDSAAVARTSGNPEA